jgi:dephospho-CoA kinase
MKLIGLTGGIGSGKSTIARRLTELGAQVIDADVVSREVVEPGQPALAAIVATFGAHVLNADGTLNRARLGDIVFTNSEAREQLNNIVHPAVRERSLKLFAEAEDHDVVVYDVPLLVESENSYSFEHIIVASAPEEIRVERLMEHRGMTESEARARIESQASEESRLSLADTVIDTSGSLEDTYSQVARFWTEITSVD